MTQTQPNFEDIRFDYFDILEANFNDPDDPDVNFFNEMTNYDTPYYFPEEIKNVFSTSSNANDCAFPIFHLNIRSLRKNIEDFKILVSEMQSSIKLFCLTETWLKDNEVIENSNYRIEGYNAVHLERKNKLGGGVLIYIKDDINYKIRSDLTKTDKEVEFLTIEIINDSSKNFLVTCCYRPPEGKISNLVNQVEKVHKAANSKPIIIAGDYNLNCLDYDSKTNIKEFYDQIMEFRMIPIINKPTRVTDTSFTLIDNFLTTVFFNTSLKKGIVKLSLSDHFPIVMSFDIPKSKERNRKVEVELRDINDVNKQNFFNDLMKTNWIDLVKELDPDKKYEFFIKTYSNLFDIHFPLKTVKIKKKNLMNPWMSKGMKKSSKMKQKLYIKYLKDSKLKQEYLDYKNLFEKMKVKAKQNYYSDLLSRYSKNSRKTWEVMKELTGKRKDKSNSLPKRVELNGKYIENGSEIAKAFNEFYVQVGPSLAKKIKKPKRCYTSYLIQTQSKLQYFDLKLEEFQEAFKTLKRNKSTGHDQLNGNIFIDSYDAIKLPLFDICKSSLKCGVFPDQLKIARVLPVFKGGDSTGMGNFRPISILPIISKLLERIMYNRVYLYLCENQLLFDKQFGFQKNTSTAHAVLELVKNITDAFVNGNFTLGIFIDLSKAFDTVDHEILLKKLVYYGINGNYLKWFKSYLSNRKQCVSFGKNEKTSELEITCGVPQGSILGPLLFLLYVNDLHRASTILAPIMFADDTNLFYSHSNLQTLYNVVNRELEECVEWFRANKLSLNAGKTKYILFHSSKKPLPDVIPDLILDAQKVERVCKNKFLGVIIDENLSWRHQIDSVSKKISKGIGILYNARPYLNKNLLKQLYFAFINSHLNYCNIIWASTCKTNLEYLSRRQKHAIRVINYKDMLYPSKPLYKEMEILNVFGLNLLQVLCLVYKCLTGRAPRALKSIFTFTEANKYKMRSFSKTKAKTMKEPFSRRNYELFTFRFRGPRLWNELILTSDILVKCTNFNKFKNGVKKMLLNSDNLKEFFTAPSE